MRNRFSTYKKIAVNNGFDFFYKESAKKKSAKKKKLKEMNLDDCIPKNFDFWKNTLFVFVQTC